jgi:hypothetical protein
MEPATPNPPYPDSVTDPDTPARRDRRLAIGIVVIAFGLLIASLLWFTRSPGRPTVPIALKATATACEEPCERFTPSVTLEWAPPESGASAEGYRLLRDGAPLEAALDGSERTFVDRDVVLGQRYVYQVVAVSGEGDSPPTAEEEAVVPTPPDEMAQLAGIYRVRLTLRSARSIGAAFGIEDPIPGKRGTDRWSFESTCDDDQGGCPSTWSGLEGEIVPDDGRWVGTVDGLPARCGREGSAPAPIDVDLDAVDVGVVDGAWAVTGFRGTATVSFRCPGFPAASATVEVTGRL